MFWSEDNEEGINDFWRRQKHTHETHNTEAAKIWLTVIIPK
jgi:hypothetical protein